MNNEEKLLIEYTFATKKSITIIGSIVFLGGGLFLGIMGWREWSWFVAGMGFLSIGMSIFGILGARIKKKIKVFEDHVEVPQGLWSKKIRNVQYSDITSILEVGGGIATIRIESSSQKPTLISSSVMEDKDFYELLEFLEKRFDEKPKETFSQTSSDKQRLLNKIFVWGGTLLAPVIIVFIRYRNRELETVEDWLVTLGIVALICGAGVLQSKLAKSASDHARKNKERLSRPEIKKLKTKWYGIILGTTAVFMALGIWALKLPREGNISMWPFFSYALMMIILTMMVLHHFMPKVEGVVANTEYYSGYFLVGMFGLIFFLLMGAHINIAKDESVGERKESPLVGRFLVTKGYKKYCYKLSHWENGAQVGEESYCNDKYPRLKEGDIARYQVFKGYFGLPHVKDVYFPRYKNAEAYIASIKGENNLRFFDIQKLAKLKGEGVWNVKEVEWINNCKNGIPSKCRLASYISHLEKKEDKVKSFLTMGCDQGDFLSCYNYFFHKGFTKIEKEKVKVFLLDECKGDITQDKEIKAVCDYIPKIKIEDPRLE